MSSYTEYMLEANFCLIFFLILYWLLLRKETNFRLVRFIMLGCIIVSLAFPFFHVNVETVATIPNLHEVMPSYWLPVIHVTGSISYIEQASFGYTLWDYITIIYIAGVIITAAIFIFQMITLLSFIRRATSLKNGNSRIIDLPGNNLTFSFFNYIFLSNAENLSEIERQRIIDHEDTHVKQLHSVDILLITFLKIVFWFNPFIHLYKKIFVQLHEFEADARAVKNHDVNMYCSLLARVALQSAGFTIANHFNNTLTLKRIHMMRTIKTGTKWWKVASCALALPLLFFVIACQDQLADKEALEKELPAEASAKYETFKKEYPGKTFLVPYDEHVDDRLKDLEAEYGHAKHIELFTTTVDGKAVTYSMIQFPSETEGAPLSASNEVFEVVDVMPQFKGGMENLTAYLRKNIRYPESAKELGAEGTAFVSFIVEKDGSLSEIKIKKGFNAACDAESERVVRDMSNWQPGKQNGELVRSRLVLPIKFKLD